MSPQRRVAAWIAEVPDDWPSTCTDTAVAAFADTIACMLAGAGDASTAAVAKAVDDGFGAATMMTGGPPRPAPSAALVNGTAAHALDFDDVLEGANTHASAVLIPAILALGEERKLDGEACLDAFLVGLQVMACLGQAMNMSHYRRGWHATSTIGTLAAAAAGARMLRVSATTAGHAVSLAVSMSSGAKCQFGTPAKPFHAGMAAMNGILAVRLATAGLTAAEEALDGDWGFHALYGGDPSRSIADVVGSLGTAPAAVCASLRPKPFPCCFSNHQAIQATCDLRSRHGLGADDVDEIEVALPAAYSANLMYREPENARQAQFCLEYCAAIALLRGHVGLADFQPAAVRRTETRLLMGRIRRAPYEPSDASAGASAEWPVTVTVRTRDGSQLAATVAAPRGLHADDLAAKFLDCASPALGAAQSADLLATVRRLGALTDLRAITHLLAPKTVSPR